MFLLVLGGAVYHGGAAIKEKRIKKIFFLFFILISIKRRNWEELERERDYVVVKGWGGRKVEFYCCF